jgi:hypothetical protein
LNTLRTASVAYAPQAPVAFAEPPVSPPVNRPVASVPAPAPTPVAAPVTPVAQPPVESVAPVPSPQPEQSVQASVPAPMPEAQTVAVFLHLSSGERIWAGRFDSPELAEQRANEIIRALNRPEPGVWAKFGNRFIRPDAVVSIELAQRRDD